MSADGTNGGRQNKLKLSYNLYHIGRCPVQSWKDKFLQELSLDCYHKIIQRLPYKALVKRRTKIKISIEHISLKHEKISMQDIGYCKQYGCSVLFLVKYKTLVSSSYEAICLLCAGLQQANSIFSMLSSGYKQANHPTFDSLDPWANTLDGDFFDDSLQDSNFYNNIKMYSSLADLEIDTTSDTDILDGLHVTPYQNICFSMEDIVLAQKRETCLSQVSRSRDLMPKRRTGNSNVKGETRIKKSIPTNVVKPTFRQSYHEMIDLNFQPLKSDLRRKFAYRVSKM